MEDESQLEKYRGPNFFSVKFNPRNPGNIIPSRSILATWKRTKLLLRRNAPR